MSRIVAVFLMTVCLQKSFAQPDVWSVIGSDERWKTDILLVVAHPDDETAVGAYLARAVFDEGKTVSIVYCNRGTGGGNSRGNEQAASMGLIREIEARRAAALLGIDRIWFLSGRDTPGQDLFRSLQEWRHGVVLEELTRVVRLARPEIVLTWLPHFVAGENHGDHQAAGVIATEAFDLAGNPTSFPAQVAAPRERLDIGNSTEGVAPWQPKKLYFFSDASHPIEGDGPIFDIMAKSPSKHMTYLEMALRLGLPHETQGDVSGASKEALGNPDTAANAGYHKRFRLLFGKSVVRCNSRGPVFEGILPSPVTYVPPPGYRTREDPGAVVELGGPFAFYRSFWPAHGIERISGLIAPEIEVSAGSYLHIPLLLSNPTGVTAEYTVKGHLPDQWKVAAGDGGYRIPPMAQVPAQLFVICPKDPGGAGTDLRWDVLNDGRVISSVTLKVTLVEWALPQ
jgi:LmbE family N-acetylglucosaminyl deacetylase